GLDPAIAFEKIQIPVVATSRGAKHAVLVLADVRPEFRSYIAPLADVLANKARWTKVTDFEDEVTGIDLHGDDLYLVANKGAPRGRLVKTSASAPDLAKAHEIVPQGHDVIEDIARAKDGLYVKIMDGGIYRLRRLGNDDKLVEIKLPFDGTIGGLFTDPT